MSSLSSILLSLQAPEALVNDLAKTLEAHVAGKGGISGTAMKLGFNALKAAKPDIAVSAAERLLPDVAKALDPLHAEFVKTRGKDFAAYLATHGPRTASAVITAVDARMASIQNTTAKALYKRFRGSAEDEVQKLLPQLGAVIAKYLP